MYKAMRRNPRLWKQRPLSEDLISYAVADVSQLLSLADKLIAELGRSQLQLLARLSLDYSQSCWLPADKGKSMASCGGAEFASLFLGMALSAQGSWLAPLFWGAEANGAAHTANASSATGDLNEGPNTAEDFRL